jgi:hypothetical protein
MPEVAGTERRTSTRCQTCSVIRVHKNDQFTQGKANAHRVREPQSPETLKETPPRIDRTHFEQLRCMSRRETEIGSPKGKHRLLGKRPLRDSGRDSDSGGGHHPLSNI